MAVQSDELNVCIYVQCIPLVKRAILVSLLPSFQCADKLLVEDVQTLPVLFHVAVVLAFLTYIFCIIAFCTSVWQFK